MEHNPKSLVYLENPQHVIDGESFLYYLQGAHHLNSEKQVFAKKLELPYLTLYLDEMYRELRQGYVLDEDKRKEFLQYAEDSRVGIGGEKWAEFMEEQANERGSLECTRLLVKSAQGQFCLTDITHGAHTKVLSQIGEMLGYGATPMMEIHTHPENSLPSPMDFGNILYGDEWGRLLQAQMVLGPDYQVLALPTYLTPMVGIEAAQNMVALFKDEEIYGANKDKVKMLENRVKKMMDLLSSQTQKHAGKAMEIINKEYQLNKGLSPEELDKIIKISLEETSQSHKTLTDRISRAGQYANRQFTDLVALSINAGLMRAARDWHIQFYVSDDMRNFYRFSA